MTVPTPALPGVIRGWATLALVVLAVLAWRILPFPGATLLGLIAVLGSWRTGEWLHGDRRWLALYALVPAVVAALESAAERYPAIWPCDAACGGGGFYAHLGAFSLPLVAATAWMALVLAVAATRWRPPHSEHQRSAPTPRYLELLVWVVLGAGLYLIATAWRLKMPCQACGAYHTAALAAAGPLRAGRLRLGPRLLAVMLGVVLLMAVFGVDLHRDQQPPAATPGPADVRGTLSTWAAEADRGRRWGSAEAPLTLVLGLDLLCPACAQEAPEWQRALVQPLRDGAVRLEVRLLARPSEPTAETLDGWFLAGAATGEGFTALGSLLGSRSGATVDQLLQGPASETLDLSALARDAQDHHADVALLLDLDAQRLAKLGYQGRTPFAALLAADGSRLMQWAGSLSGAQLAAAIASVRPPAAGAAPVQQPRPGTPAP